MAKFTLIDCRFPYEFNGGHIRGAKNIWKQEDLMSAFFGGALKYPEDNKKREVFIFHCEFSSKRGPKMYGDFQISFKYKKKKFFLISCIDSN